MGSARRDIKGSRGQVGEPKAKNFLFPGVGLKIRIFLVSEQSGFPDTLLTLDPDGFHRVYFSFKDTEVYFFQAQVSHRGPK